MTGLIYVGIIVVWAVVLVPAWLKRHDHRDSERSVDRFSRSLEALSQRDSLLGIPLPAAQGVDAEAKPRRTATAPEVFRVKRPAAPAAGPGPCCGFARQRGIGGQAQADRSRGPERLVPRRGRAGRRRCAAAGRARRAGRTHRGLRRRRPSSGPRRRPAADGRPGARRLSVARSALPRRDAPSARPASGETWEARPTTLPTYVTAPAAAEFPRVIDTTTPGAWTAAAMLERAQQQRARTERMAAAKAEAIARAKAEQAAAEARSRDEEFLAQQSSGWQAEGTVDTLLPPARRQRVVGSRPVVPTRSQRDNRLVLEAGSGYPRDVPGAVAQLVAHLVRIEGVRGSSPLSSTSR